MKIALINKVISAKGGGAERYAVDIAWALTRAGHEVDCYAVVLEDLPDSVGKFPLSKPRKPGFRKILSFAKYAGRAVLDSGIEYDVVYALTQAGPCDLYFMGGGMHKHWMTQRYPSAWFRWFRYWTNFTNLAQVHVEAQLCDRMHSKHILANSHMIKRHAMEYGGAAEDQVTVVHNGIDPEMFNLEVRSRERAGMREALGLAGDQLGLLFVSHNWKRKGLGTIIEAMGRMQEKGERYQLIVAGNGNASQFEKQAKSLGVWDRIMWYGPTSEPWKLYAAGDVFVLPTWYDPCAGVTLEAMACGLPVISSGGNGASELIIEGETGYVVEDARDGMGLANRLLNLLDDDIRTRMGLRASGVIAPRTFDVVMSETVAVMEKLGGHLDN